ncbi:MAG: hypothetical protein DSZ05_07200 [Sulfurospirillum sp.]|nr:MAG: hypothetical protein DSZ05_07200 [Sulfurospirillum sp.]
MRAFLEGVALGLGYFTRLPVPYRVRKVDAKSYGYLALTLPLAGLVLGLLCSGIFASLSGYANRYYVAFIVSVCYLFMYGFLHLEAVADVVDAWHGGHSGKERYTIMKDPNIGAIGALWTFGLALVKIASMTMLFAADAYSAVVSALILSRFGAVWVIFLGRFHEGSHFIHKMQKQLMPKEMLWITLFVAAALLFAGYLWLLPLTLAAVYLLYRWLQKSFGFVNGDGLGFMIEIVEMGILTGAVFFVNV